MAYQAIYRVWRSQRFVDVVGQSAITRTLKNAIVQNKISHAYLFTGPRGTGKTSAAKIFAKAINCHNSIDGEPCNECEICQSITEGSCNDVIEIDAASNNGVEEIRDIREKVKYAPTQADYKVYIIDEVHMLSTGAFNALLKTLEEPPKNVIFILATTEPHKIPLTIISRTQRFDFKRIGTKDIVDHMIHILTEMDIEFEEAALYVIARAAEGGMRDALSILDQGISFSNGRVTIDDAMQVTGSLTHEMMDRFLAFSAKGETERALEILAQLLSEGKEGSRFLEDLLLYCRDLLMYQQAPTLLLTQHGQLTDGFKKLAEDLASEQIYQFIKILSETQQEIRFSNHPNVYLEVATVKLATGNKNHRSAQEPSMLVEAASSEELLGLKQQIEKLSQELHQLKKNGVASSNQNNSSNQGKSKPTPTKQSYRIPTELVYQVLESATREDLLRVKDVWVDLLQLVSVTQRAMLKASDIVAASPSGIVLAFDYEIVCQRAADDEELQAGIRNGLSRLIQYEPSIVCIPVEAWGGLRKDFLSTHQGEEKSIQHTTVPSAEDDSDAQTVNEQENAVVSEAVELFGEQVVEVVDD